MPMVATAYADGKLIGRTQLFKMGVCFDAPFLGLWSNGIVRKQAVRKR
jgi:hypothetical protein